MNRYLKGGLNRLCSTPSQSMMLKNGCRAMAVAPSTLPRRQLCSIVISLKRNKHALSFAFTFLCGGTQNQGCNERGGINAKIDF